jgi:hypothetical protein
MKKSKDQIGFSLQKVTTEQFAILDDSYKEGEEIQLGTNLKFGINEEKHLIVVILSVQFLQKDKPFLKLDAACHFNISVTSWEQFLDNNKKEIVLPNGFIGHLVMLTIGTTRGILHSKTENTPFNKFLLPTINVNDIIKSDLVMKLNS